jgi:hypothetical protein
MKNSGNHVLGGRLETDDAAANSYNGVLPDSQAEFRWELREEMEGSFDASKVFILD